MEMGLSAGCVGYGVPEVTDERLWLRGKATAEFLPLVADGCGGVRSEGDIRMQSTARAVQGAEASQGHPSERAWVARVPEPPCHRAPQIVPQLRGSER